MIEKFLEEMWRRLTARGALSLSRETTTAYVHVRKLRIAKPVEQLKADA